MLCGSSERRQILQLYYEPHLSGVTRHISYLLRSVDRDRYDLRVLCSTDDSRILHSLRQFLEDERIIIVPPSRFFSWAGVRSVRTITRIHSIDTIHVHNLQSFVWGYLGAMLAGCRRVVFTPHVSTVGLPFADPLMRSMFKALRPLTHACIAVSHSQRASLLRWGIADSSRVIAIPNRIDPEEIHSELLGVSWQETRRELGIAENKVIVCQIGRLDRQKNPLFALRAAKQACHDVPELVFLFVGEGRLKEKFESEVLNLGLSDFVKMLGYRADAMRLLQASNILSLTSTWEGLPYVLAEASLLKKPIVATPTEGSRDLVEDGETGYLANSEDEFSRKLVLLARSSSLRQRMGQKSYEKNTHLFNLDGMAKELEAVYSL